MRLRPILSPYRPATTAPSGRNRKLMPMVASEMTVASPGATWPTGWMNSGASTRPAACA